MTDGDAAVPTGAPGQYGAAMGASSRRSRRTVPEARDGLQRVLEAIRASGLTGWPELRPRLEGAIAALDALLGESADLSSRPVPPPIGDSPHTEAG